MSKKRTIVRAKPRIKKHGKHWICGIKYGMLGIEGCYAETPQKAYQAWVRESYLTCAQEITHLQRA